MTLIAAGQGLNRRAVAGFRANANLEAQRVQAGDAISAQRDAQAMNTMGTGAGIGAMYGMNAARSLTPTTGGLPPAGVPAPSVVSGKVAQGGGGTAQMLTDGKLAAMGGEAAVTTGGAGAVTTGGAGAVTTGGAGAVTTGGAGAVTTGGAGAGAGAAGAGAGAGGGAMSSLAAIAGPLAIGLGAAYLITKLFD